MPKAILSSRGDKKKQFKYLCYRNRTRRVHNILIEILGNCVDKQALENEGFDYLIGNEDVAKDALAFIEMLQLRLQFQIKVKLSNLDNTDSFRVHNKENKNNTAFDQKALDEFSKTLYFTCPINKQRKIVKALKTAVPELSGNIKTADVLNKHRVEMLDVTVCGNKTAKENTADSELLRQDI